MSDPTLPAPIRAFLDQGGKLESIRLDGNGQWWHQGQRFENKRVSKLFSRSVDRTEGGTWILKVGRFTYPIEVEDTGFFVESIDLDTLEMKLSDGSTEVLAPSTLRYQSTGGLVCRIKDGRFRARFLKGPYYAVTEHLDERDGRFVVSLGTDQHVVAVEG